MNALIAQIFGYAVVSVAMSLLLWEMHVYRRKDEDVPWLQTSARLRRRLMMAGILFLVGLLVVGESTGFISLHTVRDLVIYVCALMGMAFLLLILSVRDLGDMARNAERHAVEDLKAALEAERRALQDSPGPSE